MSVIPPTPLLVCQQCKEPLQLDASLVDLAPSAYDMIVASLPPSPLLSHHRPTDSSPSPSDTLARLPKTPSAVKDAWLRAQPASDASTSTSINTETTTPNAAAGSKPPPSSARAKGKQPQSQRRASPNESFVLLQDSVVQHIPSPTRTSAVPTGAKSDTKLKSAARARGSEDTPRSSLPVAKGSQAQKLKQLKQQQQREQSLEPPQSTQRPQLPDQQQQQQQQQQEQPQQNQNLLHPSSPLSHHLRSTQRLLNLLSARTDVDHPLCAECAQILLSALQRQLDETKKERDGYVAFEREVRREREREREGGASGKEEAERRIESLKMEERKARELLREVERERAQLELEMKALEAEETALEVDEAEFWREYNDHLLVAERHADELASLRAAYAADASVLEKLERTNVYNDAFCIGHDGVFGTINGLRLGRAPGVVVEWSEINAAWGQTLLLLYTIARKLDHTFENYRLVPMGSFSRIERTTGDKATYELYGSGDLHLGRLLHNRRFDFAMVAFLDCLKQVMDVVKMQDPTVDFPHPIVKDKIGDVSVKLQFNQEDAWTRALRHVLLALKILLKWATNGTNG